MNRFGVSSKDLFNTIRSMNYTIFYIEYNYPSDHLCIPNNKLEEFTNKYEENITIHTQSNNVNNNLDNGVNLKISF